MERREHYDPEDIEGLLSERSFDELLAEEKAFVLRHISDREEYERMRTMLHYMRPDEGERSTIEADEKVRTNVLAAFRAQQQPQWRIWLNSISTWMVPRDGSALWRPALALASLAVLIVAGVITVRQFGTPDGTNGLAELHEVPGKPALSKTTLEQNEDSAQNGGPMPITDTVNSTLQPSPTSIGQQDGNEVAKATGEVAKEDYDQRFKFAEVQGSSNQNTTLKIDPVTGSTNALAEDRAASRESKTDEDNYSNKNQESIADAAVPRPSHEVTLEELQMNQSVANATGLAKTLDPKKRGAFTDKAMDDATKSHSLSEDPSLLGLIAQGW